MKSNDESIGKKFLEQTEVAQLLDIPQVTIRRWKQQGKIPFKVVRNKIYFKTSDIIQWAKSHNLPVKSLDSLSKGDSFSHLSLSRAVEIGGIYYDIIGDDIYGVLSDALNRLTFLTNVSKDRLLDDLLYREELASTGVGKGIALPHTRKRFDLGFAEPHIPIFFLKNPVNYNALDGVPVYVLIMIFTTSTKNHLKLLSKIGFLLQNEDFLMLLQQRNKHNNLLNKILEIEKESERF